jgi:hypothetical protein
VKNEPVRKMAYDDPSTDTAHTQTSAAPWLRPAREKVEKDSQKIFESQMKKLGL